MIDGFHGWEQGSFTPGLNHGPGPNEPQRYYSQQGSF